MNRLRHFYLRLRYDSLLALVLGGIVVGVIQQVGAELWQQRAVLALVGLLVGIVIAVLLFQGLLWLVRRILPAPTFPVGNPPLPRQAMILLLGGGSRDTAPMAITHHASYLEHIWLVVTERTEDIGAELTKKFHKVRSFPEKLEDHLSPAEASNAVKRAISHARILGYTQADLICDITGGTSAMTAGAIQACIESGVSLQMVAASFDEQLKAVRPIAVIALDMTPTAPSSI